ncbi:MAG: hypothetical protein U1F57_08680 [bacterium]
MERGTSWRRVAIPDKGKTVLRWKSFMEEKQYAEAVKKAQGLHQGGGYFSGGAFSSRWQAAGKLNPLSLYRALRGLNPSPYLLFEDGEYSLVGSSRSDGTVGRRKATLRPIARHPESGEGHAKRIRGKVLADPKGVRSTICLSTWGGTI